MSPFLFRIVNYLANELVVKGLANNRTFQRFALKTSEQLQKAHKNGLNNAEIYQKEVKKRLGFAGRFFEALQAEVKKDLEKIQRNSRNR